MSETNGGVFPCIQCRVVMLPTRDICEACRDAIFDRIVNDAMRTSATRCSQCGREHLPNTECVSWTEFCSTRDALAAAEARVRELEQEARYVKRVEAWVRAGTRKATLCDGEWGALEWAAAAGDYVTRRTAPTLAALGHALPDDDSAGACADTTGGR